MGHIVCELDFFDLFAVLEVLEIMSKSNSPQVQGGEVRFIFLVPAGCGVVCVKEILQ